MDELDFVGGFSRGCEFLDSSGKLQDFFAFQPGWKLDMQSRSSCQVLEKKSTDKPFEIVRVEYCAADVCGVFYCSPDQELADGQTAGKLEPGSLLGRGPDREPAKTVEVVRGGMLPALWTVATPDGLFELAPGILAKVPKLQQS